MPTTRKRTKKKPARDIRTLTLIEQKKSIRETVVKGMEMGLSYQVIANSCGVSASSLAHWMERCRYVEEKLIKMGLTAEEIDRLCTLDGQLYKHKEELVGEFGEGVISLVLEEKFWLELVYDLKKADARAETRMLGVIREAAIGNHAVTEEKRKSVVIKDPDGGERMIGAEEITTVTKQLRPQWQAAAWFLERRWPEKYAQRRIIEGQLPKDVPYDVYMTAKTLLQLPKVELERVVETLREQAMAPKQLALPEKG